MNTEVVDGEVVLVDVDGNPLVEPLPGRVQFTTYDDGHWEMRFATSHQFRLSGQELCWLRFTDADGRVRLLLYEGSIQILTILPTADQ